MAFGSHPDELTAHRQRFLDAIRDYSAEGKITGRSMPIQFLVRRTAQHVMDHAWEMEDRDLTAESQGLRTGEIRRMPARR